MRKRFLIPIVSFLIILMVTICVYAANTELQDIAELTAIASTDVLYVVDDPSGTPVSKRITALNLFDMIDTFAELNTIVADKTLVNEEDAAAWDALGTFNLGITITTGDPLTLGAVRWDDGSDEIDGEVIADDTVDNDSLDWGDMTDLGTDGVVTWGNIAEGELADSTVVTGDIKDGTVALADLNAAAYAKDLVTTAPITGAADNIFVGADSDVTVAITMLKDIVTTAPLTGAEDNVLPGADADLTLAITVLKDIVTTAPLTGAENDVLTGADADLTLALDFTTAWDFGSAAGSEWVNDGNPTTDAAGELALDTTITDHQPLWQYYDGGENMTVIAIDTAQLPAEDNEIVKYDAGADKFVLEADDSAGTTAYDDIADPDAASSITFDDDETVTWATAEDSAGSFFTIDDSDAALAANTYLLHLLYSVDDAEANADYFKCEDAGGVVFSIQENGIVAAASTITAVGSFIIGSADMAEADLEKLDGITDGTAASNKALVLGASGEIATITAATITTATITNNIKNEPKHMIFTLWNPNALYDDDTQICIWPLTDAAITITKIVITCNADPDTEIDADLKWADAFIGLANAAVIDECTTTSGTTSIDAGFDDATVASGKCMYVEFQADPDAAVTQMSWDITFDYD